MKSNFDNKGNPILIQQFSIFFLSEENIPLLLLRITELFPLYKDQTTILLEKLKNNNNDSCCFYRVEI